MKKHWPLLAIAGVVIVAGLGIRAFEPNWNDLQTADDPVEFRLLITSPGRALSAAVCDVVFAAAYGMLGIGLVRAVGGPRRPVVLAAAAIAVAALLDECENLLMIANIARRTSVTDGWLDTVGVVGWFKWRIGAFGFVLLGILAVIACIRRWRSRA